MTQDVFFGEIEHNLEQLAARRGPLPSYNLPAVGLFAGKVRKLKWFCRVRRCKCITLRDPTCPPNVRCYDLYSSSSLFLEPIVFRVFACYADESTPEGYRNAKFAIRKWYQESGWARSTQQPYAAAMVVGAGSAWEDVEPNADDMPCEHVAFRMLVAPHPQFEDVICTTKHGDLRSCENVFYALVPESFDKVERRVRECVDKLFIGDSVYGGGYLTVRKVLDHLPVPLPVHVVANIFNKMQAEGSHRLRKLRKEGGQKTLESRLCIEKGQAAWWKQLLSRCEPEWYTQSRVCTVVSLGALGSLFALPLSFIKQIAPDLLFTHRWIVLAVVSGLFGLCLLLWLARAIGRRA